VPNALASTGVWLSGDCSHHFSRNVLRRHIQSVDPSESCAARANTHTYHAIQLGRLTHATTADAHLCTARHLARYTHASTDSNA